MELLLIRHALPVRVDAAESAADPSLDPQGHEQAEHLACYLAGEKVDVIYSSPMRRALQTAEHFAAKTGLEILIEDDVAECDRFATTYIPTEESRAAGDSRWRDGMSIDEWPSYYEPLDLFHARINAAFDKLISRHPRERVAVFCHSGVICRYTSTILKHPWEEIGFFFPLYTSISRIFATPDGLRVVRTLNEASHLRGTGLPTGRLF